MIDNKFIIILKDLLRQVLSFKYPTDKTLSEFFKTNKKLSQSERALIADTVYTILRNYFKLTTVIEAKNLQAMIAVTWLKLLQLDIDLITKAGINIDQFSKLEFKDDLLSTTEFPNWLNTALLKKYSQAEIIQLSNIMQKQAPLDLRVNIMKSNVNSIINELKKLNLTVEVMPFSPHGVRLWNKSFLAKHKIFLDGLVEVQDESSQLATILLAPKRGEMIVDFCAGSGGKTLAFGMLMRNSGRIYAFDVHEKRLNNLTPRLARSGLSNIHPQLIAHENDAKIKRLHGKIDRVFVDAPCSGLGTLRRNPELKFRQTEEGIKELAKKQLSILTSASKLLKPGGTLVYATCSILEQENQDVVNEFLNNNPDFELTPVNTTLNIPNLQFKDKYMELFPHVHNTDGFFAALIKKKML